MIILINPCFTGSQSASESSHFWIFTKTHSCLQTTNRLMPPYHLAIITLVVVSIFD